MSRVEGFTLVELLVALFIISISLLGAVAFSLKTNPLIEETKNVISQDKIIAGKMDEVRKMDYESIESEPSTILVSETSPILHLSYTTTTSTTAVSVKQVTVASSWERRVYTRAVSRTITFYVYEKGINWR